jgi:hypothetical protein
MTRKLEHLPESCEAHFTQKTALLNDLAGMLLSIPRRDIAFR